MQIELLFTSFVAIEHLDLDNDAIVRYCYENLEKHPAYFNKKKSAIMKDGEDYVRDDIVPLLNAVAEKFNYLHKHFDFKNTYKQELCEAWINLNTDGDEILPHWHEGSTFSAVYYAKAGPDSGALHFMTPVTGQPYAITQSTIERVNHLTVHRQWFQPQTGLLLIFPSWLAHTIAPGTDQEDRISIAFNSQTVPNV
jgi:uncharacterized protein (TIGR02466 family)